MGETMPGKVNLYIYASVGSSKIHFEIGSINARNTLTCMKKILGGDVSIISKSTPINETMIIGGPDGKNGVMAIVRDAHDHWAGLTKEDQKQIFDWFLHNPGRRLV
ncbi:MAG: hypothetical protein GX911_01465 [Spirochaetales bacterium]|nr:hypothetical protein [Spirochaetales bacterium]